MSRKDVLHIPTPPPSPTREAGTEEEHVRRPPMMQPDEGPGETPSISGGTRVIKPVNVPGRYPGVHVT